MPRTKQFDEQEVLKKAMELFWEKGFHATSMQDLVTHLGINRASLYDTYGSKEALFDKAFSLYRKNAKEFLSAVFETEETVKGGFQKLFTTAIEEASNDPSKKGCFVVNVTTEMLPEDISMLQVLTNNKESVEEFFEEMLQKGIESGEFSSIQNTKDVAAFLFTFYSGIRVVTKVETNLMGLKKMVATGLMVLE